MKRHGGNRRLGSGRSAVLAASALLALAVTSPAPPAAADRGGNPKPPSVTVTATTANESVFVTVALNRSADAVEAVTCLVDDEPVACGLGDHVFTVDFDLAGGETAHGSTTFRIQDVPTIP
jgi:hypothetical protein